MPTKTRATATLIALLLCLGCSTLTANDAAPRSRLYRGELQILIADDFAGRKADVLYHLISAADGAVLRLVFDQAPPDPALASGTRVEIRGRRHDMQLAVESLRVLSGRGVKP